MELKGIIRVLISDEVEVGSRHVSGRRRKGGPVPTCPSCWNPMYCIFSLDHLDAELGAIGEWQKNLDFFVCPCCPMYTYGYGIHFLGDKVEVHYPGENFEGIVPVLPFPERVVHLVSVPDFEFSEVEFDAMYGRDLWDGVYHSLTSRPFRGEVAEHNIAGCPFCRRPLEGIAVIDSDDTLDLMQSFDGGSIDRVSLNWADDHYLWVTTCPDCSYFHYIPTFG